MGLHEWLDIASIAGLVASTLGAIVLGHRYSRGDEVQQTIAHHENRLVGLETWHQREGYNPPDK